MRSLDQLCGRCGTARLLILLGGAILTSTLSGCGDAKQPATEMRAAAPSFRVGQAVVGDGNEVANIDLLIGEKQGPAGIAFTNAIANQKEGHPIVLAALGPNVALKPSTVLVTKVTVKDAKQSVHLFGPVQRAVAKAIADALDEGVIPKEGSAELVIVCGVFTHWQAEDQKKVFQNNYEATKLALKRAWAGEPSIDEVLQYKRKSKSPWE